MFDPFSSQTCIPKQGHKMTVEPGAVPTRTGDTLVTFSTRWANVTQGHNLIPEIRTLNPTYKGGDGDIITPGTMLRVMRDTDASNYQEKVRVKLGSNYPSQQ